MAVRAPHGTTLEVPDPDEGMEYPKKRYQIFLNSTLGPVEVFLVSLHEKFDDRRERDNEAIEAEPECVLPTSKVVSSGAKPEDLGRQDVTVDKWSAAAENNGVYSSSAAVRAELTYQPGASDPIRNDISGGRFPPSSAGSESMANSPTITRLMPPSCDPDYWFSDEVEKEFGVSLNDMFAPTGVDGESARAPLSLTHCFI